MHKKDIGVREVERGGYYNIQLNFHQIYLTFNLLYIQYLIRGMGCSSGMRQILCFVFYCKMIWGEDPCETVKNGTGFGAFLLVGGSERALLLVETDLQKE